ncbi:MAG: hypothetical protein HOW73_26845 [Polyangiaceae bacterium]|nr:hypothetical protein [Polyangiaceae bacterium]
MGLGNRTGPLDRDRRSATRSATLAVKLLHGTLASLRAHDLVGRGQYGEAHMALLELQAALRELSSFVLDGESEGEAGRLRSEEASLRALIDTKRAGGPAR